MIVYKHRCERCKKTWTEDETAPKTHIEELIVSEFVFSSKNPFSKYRKVELCPDCQRRLKKFLRDSTVAGIAGYYVAVPTDDMKSVFAPELITTDELDEYSIIGYNVIPLEDFISDKSGKKGE